MAWTPDAPNPGDTHGLLDAPLALAVLDPTAQRLTAGNAAFITLLGLDASKVAGLDLFSFIPESDRELIECLLAGAASGQIYSAQGRGSWRRAGGGTELSLERAKNQMTIRLVGMLAATPAMTPITTAIASDERS